jgi:hypothetical protein
VGKHRSIIIPSASPRVKRCVHRIKRLSFRRSFRNRVEDVGFWVCMY